MGFHVLLVDPDAGLADEVRRAFGPVGFSITALGAGEPAVERCRQEPPDLILLAAELPDMSGFSVCNRLKRALPAVPLLLYTGEATDAAIDAHRGTRTHADDYLKKPFQVADLLARAAALLQTDPSAPPPTDPPAPPRPDGRRARPAAPGEEAPPVLQRVESGQVAARGLASALAAAAAPEGAPARKPSRAPPGATPPPGAGPAATPAGTPSGAPPPIPPPVPGHRAQTPLGRVHVQAPGKDPFEFLSEWPRDPAPPKGTPEDKLEYFRERLRARDGFLGKVRDAVAEMKAYAAQLAGERDLLQSDLDQERARAADLEHRLQEASQDAAAQEARIEDLKRQLQETDATRQSISDVLSQAMQEKEAADQEAAARIASADAERARLEGELAERSEAHARAIAALESDRADERARVEAERAEAEEKHAKALEEVRAELEHARADAGAKLALAEERITALGVERDGLVADVKRLEADGAAKDEAQRAADEELAGTRAKLDEASGRADATAGELSEAQGRIQALEEDLRRAAEQREAVAGELRAARGEAKAYEEKARAAEHAWQAKAAELAAAEQRVHDLSAALNEGRASVEGTRGELQRIDALRADAERRAAQATAERDQLAREVDAAHREAEAAREEGRGDRGRMQKLEAEVARLARLEPVAEEAARLRKEVASLRDIIQQRTSSAESSSRQAQTAAAERARLEERLAVESGKLQAQAARLESELGATRRRADELDRVLLARDAALKKATAELEERRRAQAGGNADAEKRHAGEVTRLKAAMVELEKHLEARARAEMQLKKRVQELEKGGRPAAPEPPDVARMRAQLGKLAEEVDELKGENDFLNGEVARYVQKNKELAAKLASLSES